MMILAEIAGIKPYEVGFEHFVVTPRFDLVESVSAKMPTNSGEIGVSWKSDSKGETLLTIETEAENTCDLILPNGYQLISLTADSEEKKSPIGITGCREITGIFEKI